MATSLLDILHNEYDVEDIDEGIPELFVQSPYYTNAEAIQVLADKNCVFNLLSLNCQSLPSKFDQLQVYMEYFNSSGCPFSIICLQETWLSADYDISLLHIDGYHFIHKPKASSLHGGVAYYIKNSIKFKILSVEVNDEICDSLFVEIQLNSSETQRSGKVVLGNIYRPPRDNINNYSTFTNDIDRTLSFFENTANVVLLGDFNIDLMKLNEKDHINTFFDTLLSSGFLPKITLPTRITPRSRTLIDNCFVKSLFGVSDITSGILQQNVSDHQPYFVCFDSLTITRVRSKFVKAHTQTEDALLNLKNELATTCSLENFMLGTHDDPNHNYNILDSILTTSFNKHVPIKFVKYCKYKHKKSGWISQGIINSIKFRDGLYKKLKETQPTDVRYETLKTNLNTYNRILKHMIRTAKRQHYHTLFNRNKHDIKKTWDTIKQVISPSGSKNDNQTSFLINDLPHSDPSTISNEFNKYFTEIGAKLASNVPQIPNMSHSSFLTNPPPMQFTFI